MTPAKKLPKVGINTFQTKQQCILCNRHYNLFSLWFDKPEASKARKSMTMMLPVLLPNGTSACEQCVFQKYKRRTCDKDVKVDEKSKDVADADKTSKDKNLDESPCNNETDNDNDETDKDNNETDKDNNETDKDNNETDKDNNETDKDNNETDKDNDETDKDNDETDKDNDETDKDNDKTGKDNDETDKDNDETSKDNDETSKDNDEIDNEEKVQDNKEKVQGNKEKVQGNKEKVQGNKEKVQGNKEKVQGNKEKVQGNKEKVQGNKEKVQGNEEKVQGNEEKVQGNEEKVQGNEEKVQDNEEKFQENEEKCKDKENKCKDDLEKGGNDKDDWDYPLNMNIIQGEMDIIIGKLNAMEKVEVGESFQTIAKVVGDTEISIKTSLVGIQIKIDAYKQDLKIYQRAINHIYELTQLRVDTFDVDSTVKKMKLATEIFELEAKMKDRLSLDIALIPKLSKDATVAAITHSFKTFTIHDMMDQVDAGREVFVGITINFKMYWAEVTSPYEGYYDINHFKSDIEPKFSATLVQLDWIQNDLKNLSSIYTFIDIEVEGVIPKEKLKRRDGSEIRHEIPSNYKVLIKMVPNFKTGSAAEYFYHMCTGELGKSFVGRKLRNMEYIGIYIPNETFPDSLVDSEQLEKDTSQRQSLGGVFFNNAWTSVLNGFEIALTDEKFHQRKPPIAHIVSGLPYLTIIRDCLEYNTKTITNCGLHFQKKFLVEKLTVK